MSVKTQLLDFFMLIFMYSIYLTWKRIKKTKQYNKEKINECSGIMNCDL